MLSDVEVRSRWYDRNDETELQMKKIEPLIVYLACPESEPKPVVGGYVHVIAGSTSYVHHTWGVESSL